MADYNPTPATLVELLTQCQEWDGDVVRVVPYFTERQPGDDPAMIGSVGVWLLDEYEQEYELCYRLSGGRWHLSGDGAGDPCTSGGSVLTGRDLG